MSVIMKTDAYDEEIMLKEIRKLHERIIEIENRYASLCPVYPNLLKLIQNEEILKEATDAYYEKKSEEKATMLSLKQKILQYADKKMEVGTVAAWIDIIRVYNEICIQPIELKDMENELNILYTVLGCMREEAEIYRERGIHISVLQFDSMNEIIEVYYQTIFMLRRVAYHVEETKMLNIFMKERALSPVFIRHILEKAQIYAEDKQMLLERIREIEEADLKI